MSRLQELIDNITEIASHPAQMVKKHKQAGRKMVGCMPVYTPEEIVYASGAIPIGMWGGQVSLSKSGSYFPPFACSIIQSVMEFALIGVYDDLEAAIIPAPCDTLKSLGQDWLSAAPQIKAIHIVYPQMRKIEAGVSYLASEFEHVRQELKIKLDVEISDEAITNAIEVYNVYRRTMRLFTQVATKYPQIITPKIRHNVIKAAYFVDKAEYTKMVQALIEELGKETPQAFKGKKIILTGIMVEPEGLLDLLEEYQLTVVGDDLAQESRQFRTDVPEGINPLERIARQYSQMEGCSVVYDPLKLRGQMLLDMVKEQNADAAIYCMLKFCDPEEFDYPIMKKEFEAAGIPLFNLEIDQQMQSLEQARTRIQGFSEILSF